MSTRTTQVVNSVFTGGVGWKALTIFVFFCLSVFILGLSLIPMPIAFHMFRTEFINMDNVSIENFQGVTKILWGTWNACYYNADSHQCISKHWTKSPYSLVVIENGNQRHANTEQLWFEGLYVQFGAFLAILGIIPIFIALHFQRKYLMQPVQNNWSVDRINSLRIIRILMLILITMMVVMLLADSFVFMSIQNGMQSLATGGTASVKTMLGPGYQINLAFSPFFFFSCVYVIIYANTQINPSTPKTSARGGTVTQFKYLDW